MIASKQDLKIYLDADRRANHISGLSLFFNKTWRYLKYMRKIEYLTNCSQGKLSKILLFWYRYKFRNLSVLTGISIPPNTFGKGLYIPSNPQPIGFSGILLAKRQNSFYCTYFLHNRNVADTKSPYPIKRLEVIRWFNQKSMVFNQSLS